MLQFFAYVIRFNSFANASLFLNQKISAKFSKKPLSQNLSFVRMIYSYFMVAMLHFIAHNSRFIKILLLLELIFKALDFKFFFVKSSRFFTNFASCLQNSWVLLKIFTGLQDSWHNLTKFSKLFIQHVSKSFKNLSKIAKIAGPEYTLVQLFYVSLAL